MTLSEAVGEAQGLKRRGVVLRGKPGPLRVLVAFDRLWVPARDDFDRLVPFCPTVAQVADDRWRATNEI